MKNYFALPLFLSSILLLGCSGGTNSSMESNLSQKKEEEVVLPDAFKDTNFAYCGWDPGVALVFDANLTPSIQNVSTHVEFYEVECTIKPLTKKVENNKTTFFLHFTVIGQVIDDGYLKNGTDYKFWLSYNEPDYFCGLSKDDDTLTEPEITLMEGTM